MTNLAELVPDIKISVNQIFGINTDMKVDGFSKKNEYVPEIDSNYKFDRDTTLAIISGFAFNKRVLIQGYHGTGKSTHIEQVAARLNWPCIRVNLDSHISRIDLIGKDAIVVKNGKQITEFKEGILPWSIQIDLRHHRRIDIYRSGVRKHQRGRLLPCHRLGDRCILLSAHCVPYVFR